MIKTDAPGFIKDQKTGVVTNTNLGEYQAILARRRLKAENDTLINEIKTIRRDLDEVMRELKNLREKFDQ